MTPLTRRRLLLYLSGTFVLGAIAGGAIGYGRAQLRTPPRSFDRDAMRARFRVELSSQLELTAEQQKQLDPILRQNMEEFEAVHREQFAKIGEVMKRGRERIAAILSPEQLAKYDTMERERERRWKEERGGPRRGGKPGGPGPDTPKR